MKIQYLSYKKKNIESFICNEIKNPHAFDSFDVNIISLDDHDIWKSSKDNGIPLDIDKELVNLFQIISDSNSPTIILLPQDRLIYYDYWSNTYHKSKCIRHCLNGLFSKNLTSLNASQYKYAFENNVTIINELCIPSSFYFSNNQSSKTITESKDSKKTTTIYDSENNVYYSFLKLEKYEEIMAFLSYLKIDNKEDNVPDWLKNYSFFNDKELLVEKETTAKKIEELIAENKKIEKSINDNMFYKKALTVNGEELVVIVYKILEELLGVDLSDFIDKKHEDFNFVINNTRIIGEIKGVTTNVKNAHISQLDNHVSEYKDNNEEAETEEILKPILIINHQRNVPISEREQINTTQENKAIKEDVLIIETYTLLMLLEKNRKSEVTRNEIVEIIIGRSGILKIDKSEDERNG